MMKTTLYTSMNVVTLIFDMRLHSALDMHTLEDPSMPSGIFITTQHCTYSQCDLELHIDSVPQWQQLMLSKDCQLYPKSLH